MDQVRNIRISGSKKIFWQITQAKDNYIKAVGVNRMTNFQRGHPGHPRGKGEDSKPLCNVHAHHIEYMTHCSDSALEIEEQ
jgi:hypothetical protein